MSSKKHDKILSMLGLHRPTHLPTLALELAHTSTIKLAITGQAMANELCCPETRQRAVRSCDAG